MKTKPRWRHFLVGMASIWPRPARAYGHPTGGGYQADRAAMARDFSALGRDMRSVIDRHEQAPRA